MPTDQLSRTFAALADPTRRDLVARLTLGDATLTELAAPYPMSLQAVSKHLTVLQRAGLVSRGKDAQRRPVHLEPSVLEPVTDWLETYRRQAEARYQRLDAVLADLAATAPDAPRVPSEPSVPSELSSTSTQTPAGGAR